MISFCVDPFFPFIIMQWKKEAWFMFKENKMLTKESSYKKSISKKVKQFDYNECVLLASVYKKSACKSSTKDPKVC